MRWCWPCSGWATCSPAWRPWSRSWPPAALRGGCSTTTSACCAGRGACPSTRSTSTAPIGIHRSRSARRLTRPPSRCSIPSGFPLGLALVKWWLLAIPHYAVVGVFLGGIWYGVHWGGAVALLVLIAALTLLFTGRYPRGIFDLVMGMNRWALRVAAYAGLMTDVYPPFRLDMGPDEQGSDDEVPAAAQPQ